jgi:hypothetical protein
MGVNSNYRARRATKNAFLKRNVLRSLYLYMWQKMKLRDSFS